MDHNTILAALMLRNRDSGTSGLPSGSSPNQYLVTDGEGNAKWEDKLCWSEKGEVIVIPEQTITTAIGSPVYVESQYAISAGDPVTVVWDGVSFDCVAAEKEGVVCVGNAALGSVGEDTGEPFLIDFASNGTMIFAKTAGVVSVIATAECDMIHPIESKYIDGALTKIFYGIANEMGSGNVTLFNPVAEIAKTAQTHNVALRLHLNMDGNYDKRHFWEYHLVESFYYTDDVCEAVFVNTMPTTDIDEDAQKGLQTRVVHAHGTYGVEHYIYSFTAEKSVTKSSAEPLTPTAQP